jgi:hypothetical protein
MSAPVGGPSDTPEPTPPQPRISWLLLFACLLGPAILTSLVALADRSSKGPAPAVAVIAGLLGGIGCGIILGRRLGRTAGLQIVFGLILAGAGAVASITIATIGCLASGYHLDFR